MELEKIKAIIAEFLNIDALDYRKWFEFQMFFRRGEETKKPLTNASSAA